VVVDDDDFLAEVVGTGVELMPESMDVGSVSKSMIHHKKRMAV
jgi:hypothetical protein